MNFQAVVQVHIGLWPNLNNLLREQHHKFCFKDITWSQKD